MERVKSEIPDFFRFLIAFAVSVIAMLVVLEFTSPAGASIVGFLVFTGFAVSGWLNWIYIIVLGISVLGTYILFGGGEA
jgi:hypothetical protein